MSILCLDLGTTMGYAVAEDSGRVRWSGVAPFQHNRFDGGGMRFVLFKKWLEDNVGSFEDDSPIKAVYYEEVRNHKGIDAAQVYGGLMATLQAFCEESELPYKGIPVGTIKKYVTGKGNASKADMIASVQARGYQPKDDNEADAIGIALCVLEK